MATEQLEAFFKEADADGSGELTLDELKIMLRKRHYKGTDREIEEFFEDADISKDNKVSLEEYLGAMANIPSSTHNEAFVRRTFALFDNDGSGTIDVNELQNVFDYMKKTNKANLDVDAMMKAADVDASGTLDYEEFISAIQPLLQGK